AREPELPAADPDGALYDRFLEDADRRRFAEVRSTPPQLLGARDFGVRDPRRPELLFRHRARHRPDTLDAAERRHWDDYRRERLTDGSGLSELGFTSYFERIATLRGQHASDPDRLALLDQLDRWGRQLQSSLA